MISVLLPTRKRYEQLARMTESLFKTAKNPVEVVIYADEDDLDSALKAKQLGIKFVIGPRITLSQCWNEAARLATGDIFMQGNDDIIFKTPAWDETIEGEFSKSSDKILLVHGGDGGNCKENFGPHPFVHRRWFNILGYFTPPYFSSDYGDTWVNDVANMIGRRKYVPIEVEHRHFLYNKAEVDSTTIERLTRGGADNVEKLYSDLLPERESDARKLKAMLNTPYVDDKIKLSIMVLTQPSRHQYLKRILHTLNKQLEGVKDVEVNVRMFDDNLTLGENRQVMRHEARGEYSCFVDDDDLVADDYVARILPLLDGVDYVGFRLQCYVDGTPQIPTFHSLTYKNWHQDDKGYYRDISHINPIKTVLALRATMEGGYGEDSRWSETLRSLNIINTQHYIADVMYHYYSRSVKDDDKFVFTTEPAIPKPKFIPKREPTYFERQGYTLKPCPKCGEALAISPTQGTLRCNQCGHQYR